MLQMRSLMSCYFLNAKTNAALRLGQMNRRNYNLRAGQIHLHNFHLTSGMMSRLPGLIHLRPLDPNLLFLREDDQDHHLCEGGLRPPLQGPNQAFPYRPDTGWFQEWTWTLLQDPLLNRGGGFPLALCQEHPLVLQHRLLA